MAKFAKQESIDGKLSSGGPMVIPTFGFYVRGLDDESRVRTSQLFCCSVGYQRVTVFLNSAETISSPEIVTQLKDKLNNLFLGEIDINMRQPSILLSVVADKLYEFKEIVLWFRDAIATN